MKSPNDLENVFGGGLLRTKHSMQIGYEEDRHTIGRENQEHE